MHGMLCFHNSVRILTVLIHSLVTMHHKRKYGWSDSDTKALRRILAVNKVVNSRFTVSWNAPQRLHHRFNTTNTNGMTIGVGAGKFLAVRRIFARTSPKSFCALFAFKFSPAQIKMTFLVWPLEKVSMCFSANVERHFLTQRTLVAIFPGFSDILPRFSWIFCQDFHEQIKTVGGALTPLHPSYYNTGHDHRFKTSNTIDLKPGRHHHRFHTRVT